MVAIALAGASVVITCVASHAFHSWLKLRGRVLTSESDRAAIDARFDELAKWRNKIDNVVANLPRR